MILLVGDSKLNACMQLTEEQGAKLGNISDGMSMQLAKVLQKALNLALEELTKK